MAYIYGEMPNLILTDGALERSARTVPMLGEKFRFLRGRAATNFMAGVVDFARQEKARPYNSDVN
jgi:hypothetical protein